MSRYLKIGTLVGVLALYLAIGSHLFSAPKASAENNTSANSLQVTGQGSVKSAPDLAYLNLGVMTTAKDAKAAQQSNDAKIAGIIKSLKALGIKDEQIQTKDFNIYPRYNYSKEGTSTLEGYEVQHRLTVLVTEVTKVGEALDKAIGAGANNNVSVDFGLSKAKQTQAYNEALKEALTSAKSKATTLAGTIGISLGKPNQIVEAGAMPEPIIRNEAAKMKIMDSSAVPIQAGHLEIQATVHVSYNY